MSQQHERRVVQIRAPRVLQAVVLAAVVAAVVSAAYYSADFRSLAHTYGVWVLVGWLVSVARPLGQAIAVSAASLAVSVVVFFIGLKVVHDLKWSAAGSTLGVDWDRAGLWLVFAVPAGALLGSVGHFTLHDSWRGAASRAVPMGMVAAEGLTRLIQYGPSDAAAALDTLALVVLFVLSAGVRQGRLTAVFTAAMVLPALLLLRVPDVLEAFTVWG